MRAPASLLALGRMVRLQNAMMVLCAVLVSAYGASMYASIHRAYHQTMDDATATLASIARSSEVGTNRSIFAIDEALLGVERLVDTLLPQAQLDGPAVKALLHQFDDQTLVVSDIMIFDLDGHLLNEAGWAIELGADSGNRPFLTAHAPGAPPALFIGRPRRSRATGGWSVMMSRPLTRGGKLVGVIAAEVPVSVFTDFYNSVVANSGVGVKLLLDDGTVIAGEPHQDELIGQKLPDAAALLAAADTRRLGIIGDSPDDASPAVISFTHIATHPLLLIASSAACSTFSVRGATRA